MPDEARSKKKHPAPPRQPVAVPSESLEAELAALEAMLPPAQAPRTGQSKKAPFSKKHQEEPPTPPAPNTSAREA